MRPLSLLLLLAACDDVEKPGTSDEQELVTTVALTFTPDSGGAALEFRWTDLELDGSPVVDAISLADAEDYALTVSFLDELQDPAEDIGEEVAREADEHQVFFTGSGVAGPDPLIAHAYADQDPNGDPLGLEGTITTLRPGTGELTVTLRHLPAEGGAAVKGPGLAEEVAAEGFAGIGGENDVQVTFPLTVE